MDSKEIRQTTSRIAVQGTAKVTVGGEVRLVTENQSVYRPVQERHRNGSPWHVSDGADLRSDRDLSWGGMVKIGIKTDMVAGERMAIEQRLADVNAYLSTGIHTVQGWCIPHLWQTLWPLYQEIGDGPVAEIGLFEGKFFIGLCKTFGITSRNRAAAIDVFDIQQFNLDGAGVGKLDVLKRNLGTHGIAEDAVKFVQADSLALTHRDADRLVSEIGPLHFFSVDGCHEVVHTVNDIEFAMSVTANHGIIAVDDYTNPNWPGVQEAVARMYLSRDFRFVPLAVTCNKLLLTSYSYHSAYLSAIESYLRVANPDTRVKKVKRFGFDTLTVQPNMQRWSNLPLQLA